MILRNKKTGKIQEIVVMPVVDGYPNESILVNGEASLKDFNEVWEDYVPIEPLIKDEKIRKAVRAWAEANGMTCCHYGCGEFEQEYGEICAGISFGGQTDYLEERHYTIAELCGEEEE